MVDVSVVVVEHKASSISCLSSLSISSSRHCHSRSQIQLQSILSSPPSVRPFQNIHYCHVNWVAVVQSTATQ